MKLPPAILLAVLVGMPLSIGRAEPPAPARASADDGMPELKADVFRLGRIEKRPSERFGTLSVWIFKFRHHEAKALSFYGYHDADGDFFSGYGDFWRFSPGDPSNRRYYGYLLHGPKGWRKADPWEFPIVFGFMAQRETPRELTIEPGVETEIRFNLGHGSFDRRPGDKMEVRIGIFAPEGDFWSAPIQFPGIQ